MAQRPSPIKSSAAAKKVAPTSPYTRPSPWSRARAAAAAATPASSTRPPDAAPPLVVQRGALVRRQGSVQAREETRARDAVSHERPTESVADDEKSHVLSAATRDRIGRPTRAERAPKRKLRHSSCFDDLRTGRGKRQRRHSAQQKQPPIGKLCPFDGCSLADTKLDTDSLIAHLNDVHWTAGDGNSDEFKTAASTLGKGLCPGCQRIFAPRGGINGVCRGCARDGVERPKRLQGNVPPDRLQSTWALLRNNVRTVDRLQSNDLVITAAECLSGLLNRITDSKGKDVAAICKLLTYPKLFLQTPERTGTRHRESNK